MMPTILYSPTNFSKVNGPTCFQIFLLPMPTHGNTPLFLFLAAHALALSDCFKFSLTYSNSFLFPLSLPLIILNSFPPRSSLIERISPPAYPYHNVSGFQSLIQPVTSTVSILPNGTRLTLWKHNFAFYVLFVFFNNFCPWWGQNWGDDWG